MWPNDSLGWLCWSAFLDNSHLPSPDRGGYCRFRPFRLDQGGIQVPMASASTSSKACMMNSVGAARAGSRRRCLATTFAARKERPGTPRDNSSWSTDGQRPGRSANRCRCGRTWRLRTLGATNSGLSERRTGRMAWIEVSARWHPDRIIDEARRTRRPLRPLRPGQASVRRDSDDGDGDRATGSRKPACSPRAAGPGHRPRARVMGGRRAWRSSHASWRRVAVSGRSSTSHVWAPGSRSDTVRERSPLVPVMA